MKEQFVTNAINLKSYSLSEADKIVLMYSKEKGLMRAAAKGAKKQNSSLSGRMELLCANRMLMKKGRSLDTICQAEALNTFFNIRNDMDKLFYSVYCSEIAANFGTENDPNSEEIYNLLYNFLDTVSNAETKEQVMLSVLRFQLKIMNITGYSIELSKCVKCSKTCSDNEFYFSVQNGGILCPKCIEPDSKKLKIHYKITEFLNTLQKEDFKTHTRYDDTASEKVLGVCINLLKDYIEYYSPKRFKTSKVLESVMI